MSPVRRTERVATEIARDAPGVIVFEASQDFVEELAGEWSEPVQLHFEQRTDGVYEVVQRTVALASDDVECPACRAIFTPTARAADSKAVTEA